MKTTNPKYKFGDIVLVRFQDQGEYLMMLEIISATCRDTTWYYKGKDNCEIYYGTWFSEEQIIKKLT